VQFSFIILIDKYTLIIYIRFFWRTFCCRRLKKTKHCNQRYTIFVKSINNCLFYLEEDAFALALYSFFPKFTSLI